MRAGAEREWERERERERAKQGGEEGVKKRKSSTSDIVREKINRAACKSSVPSLFQFAVTEIELNLYWEY